jgi:hypothetical protein
LFISVQFCNYAKTAKLVWMQCEFCLQPLHWHRDLVHDLYSCVPMQILTFVGVFTKIWIIQELKRYRLDIWHPSFQGSEGVTEPTVFSLLLFCSKTKHDQRSVNDFHSTCKALRLGEMTGDFFPMSPILSLPMIPPDDFPLPKSGDGAKSWVAFTSPGL